MENAVITLIGIIIGAVSTSIVTPIITSYLNHRKMQAEYAQEIASGGVTAVNAMEAVLEEYKGQISDLKKDITEIKADRDRRGEKVNELTGAIEKLNRDSAKEISSLQDTVSAQQVQITNLQTQNDNLKRQILVQYQALENANIDIEIDPSLKDTLKRMKAAK